MSKKYTDKGDVENTVNQNPLWQNISNEEKRKKLKDWLKSSDDAVGWLGYDHLTDGAKEYIAELLKELGNEA